SYDDLREADDKPILIPPTWSKVFQDRRLQLAWTEARKAINAAQRIIFIGFSFPQTDHHIRFLLAAGLMRNIYLSNLIMVNPNSDAIKESLGNIFSNHGRELITPYPTRTQGFIQNWENIRSIGRADTPYFIEESRPHRA